MSTRNFNLPEPGDNQNNVTLSDLGEHLEEVTETEVAQTKNISAIRTMERGSVSFSSRTIAVPAGAIVQVLGADPYRTKVILGVGAGPGNSIILGSYSDVAGRQQGMAGVVASAGGVSLNALYNHVLSFTEELYAMNIATATTPITMQVWTESDR